MAKDSRSMEQRRKDSAEKVDAIRELAQAGWSGREIAEELKMAKSTVHNYASRHGIKLLTKPGPKSRPRPPRPEKFKPRAKRKEPQPMNCRICETREGRKVPAKVALVQIMEHPGDGEYWPRCNVCQERIAGHVAGLERARERKVAGAAAAEHAVSEGWE